MTIAQVYSDLVLFGVCRSNHHRIAVDALGQLRGADAAAWRAVFLHHHPALLEGAKAPDERFKDFKNHVLHVKDGYWGGAPDAAVEWHRRTVRALQAKDWALAAYSAGVLSHYVVDPVQPFHTAQTETENVIHRAVEQSFSKSYKTLRAILLGDLGGYPDVPVATGPDWLREMVRAGAERSNPFYDAVIDHYDFARGAKNPPAGLDQELKDIVAGLIGYATSLFARVLEKCVADAAVAPPAVNLTLDTIFTALKIPAKAVIGALDDAKARAEVAAQYEEFVKTGKVRATLGDDDAAVRRMYADEIAKIPLSTLDCQWPREIGTAHGTGATPRPVRKTPRAPAAPAPAAVAPVAAVEPAPALAAVASATAPLASDPAPVAAVRASPRLAREADVVDAPSIGPKTAERFYKAGMKTVADLLSLTPEEIAKRLETRHISPQIVRDWQDQALLACTVPNLSGTAAQILVACEVRTAEALAGADPATLAAQVQTFAVSPEGQSLLRSGRSPSPDQVRVWIDSARSLGVKAAA
ncbi:MAG: DUF4332 domain-containing protein [Alphaproteobacteria bacterium]|nr:DUF4332 domain-containing protein [Alphaproteobacteria bacterium]